MMSKADDKPILFSGTMVRAIRLGRKTMTRRIAKYSFKDVYGMACLHGIWKNSYGHEIPDDLLAWYMLEIAKPKYQVGDTLWVRETWARISDWTTVDPEVGIPDGYIYREDWDNKEQPKWHPSIFMPREACRIRLRVTEVRCERVQDISPHDAWLEGCRIGNSFPWEEHIPELQEICRGMFVSLWDSINGKRGHGWVKNDWVWVYRFEVIE